MIKGHVSVSSMVRFQNYMHFCTIGPVRAYSHEQLAIILPQILMTAVLFCISQVSKSGHVLFPLGHEILNFLSCFGGRVVSPICRKLSVHLRLPPALLHKPTDLRMRLAHNRNLLLIFPDQIRRVAHRDWDQEPARSHAHGQRRSRSQKYASVSRNYRTCESRDEDVYRAGQELLSGLRRGS